MGRGPSKREEELVIVPPRPEKMELVARIAQLKAEMEARQAPTIVKIPGEMYQPGGYREFNDRWWIKELSNGDRVYRVKE